ncbi:MAG TPA: L,D-transpeptidase family protein [Xanthobacteraceae bacterium]|nr:L,D-transpeptidase family protein [Xanthobacteraceae bacterium]
MSTQRLVFFVFIASLLGAGPAFAQSSPLNLDQTTFTQPRNATAPQPVSVNPTESYEPTNSGPQNLFEFLFGGLRPPVPPLFQNPAEGDAAITPDADPDGDDQHRPLDSKFLPQPVDYNGPEKAGTIIIDTRHRFLYLVQGGGHAMRYGIGVGRPGFTWAGVKQVSGKREWPDWIPPEEMLQRRPDLPHFMAGGPENPLGARAIYLGSTLYRIHGSNEPWTIGQAVSSGCIRMRNEDVIDLYERVKLGTKVVVI